MDALDRSLSIFKKPLESRTDHDVGQLMEWFNTLEFPAHIKDRVDMRKMCTEIQYERFPARTEIFREYDSGDKFYIVLSGCVNVFVANAGLINTLKPGNVFGDAALQQPNAERTATVVTSKRSDICEFGVLSAAAFTRCLQNGFTVHNWGEDTGGAHIREKDRGFGRKTIVVRHIGIDKNAGLVNNMRRIGNAARFVHRLKRATRSRLGTRSWAEIWKSDDCVSDRVNVHELIGRSDVKMPRQQLKAALRALGKAESRRQARDVVAIREVLACIGQSRVGGEMALGVVPFSLHRAAPAHVGEEGTVPNRNLCTLRQAGHKEKLYQAGDSGRHFYVVLSGTVTVTLTKAIPHPEESGTNLYDPPKDGPAETRTLTPGQCFGGEIILSAGARRCGHACIATTTAHLGGSNHAELAQIDGSLYLDWLFATRALGVREKLGFLTSTPFCGGWPLPKVKKLANALKAVEVSPGASLLTANEAPTRFFFLVSGELKITTGVGCLEVDAHNTTDEAETFSLTAVGDQTPEEDPGPKLVALEQGPALVGAWAVVTMASGNVASVTTTKSSRILELTCELYAEIFEEDLKPAALTARPLLVQAQHLLRELQERFKWSVAHAGPGFDDGENGHASMASVGAFNPSDKFNCANGARGDEHNATHTETGATSDDRDRGDHGAGCALDFDENCNDEFYNEYYDDEDTDDDEAALTSVVSQQRWQQEMNQALQKLPRRSVPQSAPRRSHDNTTGGASFATERSATAPNTPKPSGNTDSPRRSKFVATPEAHAEALSVQNSARELRASALSVLRAKASPHRMYTQPKHVRARINMTEQTARELPIN
jgi:CRP-like cAMP-binding protein